jgi:phosphoribosylamine-glycine ligase
MIGRSQRKLRNMLVHKIWCSQFKVVIEEFLDGIELSCFVLTDGKVTKYQQPKITNALAKATQD